MGKIIRHGAREAALGVLVRVDSSASFADILLERALSELDLAERPLATELVYGVLRHRIRLDHVIDTFSKTRSSKLEHRVANALRIGVYQLLFLSGVPARAAINETVNLVRTRGGKTGGEKKAGFVNAVLRNVDRGDKTVTWPDIEEDPVVHVSILYSHPAWMVERWIKRYGLDETVELCRANLARPPRTIRTNTLIRTRDTLAEELRAAGGPGEAGFKVRETAYSPEGLVVERGIGVGPPGPRRLLDPNDARYYIQDEASQIIPHILAPSPGETILDACAAPGGKTTHIAALMSNSGRVYAVDKHKARLAALVETARRLGIDMKETVEADSTAPLKPLKPPCPGDGLDAILLDAPCSGMGVLRRAPDIKIRRTESDIEKLSKTQSRLLDNLAGYLRPGGRIVYSVCTSEPEETVRVVEGFLKTNKGFEREDASGYVPEGCRALIDGSEYLRTYPHRHGVDGFFAARLRKIKT